MRTTPLVHDAAVHLDTVMATAVRYGTASPAWQQAAARFLEKVHAVVEAEGALTLHVGPGHLLEVGPREGSGDLHTHAWHDVWRDGLRVVRWVGPAGADVATDVLRAMCRPADAYHERALHGGDLGALRAWAGAERDDDVVTAMLHARRGRPGLTLDTLDPTLPTGGPLRDAIAVWTVTPRPDATRVLVDTIAAGVEAARRPGAPPREASSVKTWRRTAAALDTHASARLVAVLEARTHEAMDPPDVLAREWLALMDAALALASVNADMAWEALARAMDAQGRIADENPEVVRLWRLGLSDRDRAHTFAARVASLPAHRAWEAARWLVRVPAAVTEEVSRALAAAHDAERARALEEACVAERADGATFTAGTLYHAHMSAPSPVASWAIGRLHDHHAGELATRDALRVALGHPDRQVQHLALVGLGGDRSDATREALERALRASRREIVAHALEEFLQLHDDGARASVLARIHEPDFGELPAVARLMFLDAAARLEGDAAAAWMGDILAQRGWFLARDVKERQHEVRQVLATLGTPWARAVLARGEKP